MRRWLSLPKVAGAWETAQRTAERTVQPRCGSRNLSERWVSTAALQPDWPLRLYPASVSAPVSLEHGSASSVVTGMIGAMTERVSAWLAAPKRKVLIG